MTTTIQSSASLRRALYERHRSSVLQVERLAARVARIGERSWEELLGVVGAGSRGYAMDQFRLRAIIESMLARLIAETMSGFERIAARSWRETVNAWLGNVPQEVWIRLLRERGVSPMGDIRREQDRYHGNAFGNQNDILSPAERAILQGLGENSGHFQEREPDPEPQEPAYMGFDPGAERIPGADESGRVPEREWRRLLREVVFPPPSEQRVQQILTSSLFPDRQPWAAHLAREGFSFDQIVGQVASGMSQGEAIGPIAKRIMPLVNAVRYRAVRIARTEGLRVADQMQRESWKHTRTITKGYRRNEILDARTRPLHRVINGVIYWTPGNIPPGGLAADQMPALPDEPNCRGYFEPCLAVTASMRARSAIATWAVLVGGGRRRR